MSLSKGVDAATSVSGSSMASVPKAADSGVFLHCEDCEMNGDETPATVTWDVPWKPYKLHLCASCENRRQESAPGYGGDPNDSGGLAEQMSVAYTLDGRLR